MSNENMHAEDPVVEANRQLLLDRSRIGITKYGTTLAAAGLTRNQIARHALEEALDLANYLQTIIQADPVSPVVSRLRSLIADDSYVLSFQSVGQYRSALLKEIDRLQEHAEGSTKIKTESLSPANAGARGN
jgi:hypothetical protein